MLHPYNSSRFYHPDNIGRVQIIQLLTIKKNSDGNITVTVLVINVLTLPRLLSVETSCTKFHENSTNRIGADTTSQTDGRACCTHKALLFLHKECLKGSLFIRFREIH
jgi:hypothetical protein